MDDATARLLTPSDASQGDGRSYVVTRSALLQNRVFNLGEVWEVAEFGHHFVRLRDCGHVRCIDPLYLGAE